MCRYGSGDKDNGIRISCRLREVASNEVCPEPLPILEVMLRPLGPILHLVLDDTGELNRTTPGSIGEGFCVTLPPRSNEKNRNKCCPLRLGERSAGEH